LNCIRRLHDTDALGHGRTANSRAHHGLFRNPNMRRSCASMQCQNPNRLDANDSCLIHPFTENRLHYGLAPRKWFAYSLQKVDLPETAVALVHDLKGVVGKLANINDVPMLWMSPF